MANMQFNSSLAARFSSASQQARVLTENWVMTNGYCLACENDRLSPTTQGTKARDFTCSQCLTPYELKSSRRHFRDRVIDGAYGAMMERISASETSSLLLLRYTSDYAVSEFFAIHHSLITPEVIEKRRPLSEMARRAGWVGCNILLSRIPPEGRIPIIESGALLSKANTRGRYALAKNLQQFKPEDRGWLSSLLSGLHRFGKPRFTLHDAYTLEPELRQLYPNNHHIRPKIRQQLQRLRDAGLLRFESPGVYRLTAQKEVTRVG